MVICYTSEVHLPGSIIENSADAIEHFFIIEHSFLGDLDVTFICPDGSEMLTSYINDLATGTDLGFPWPTRSWPREDYYWGYA